MIELHTMAMSPIITAEPVPYLPKACTIQLTQIGHYKMMCTFYQGPFLLPCFLQEFSRDCTNRDVLIWTVVH